jgi:predicted DNA-binding protein
MVRSALGGPRRHVVLAPQQDEKLVKLAAKTGITTSEHIRRAIDAYFRALEMYASRTKKS